MIGVLSGGSFSPLRAGASPGGGAHSGRRLYSVRAYGATGNGRDLDTRAINQAIDACHSAGGGTVYVPPGIYVSGTIHLKSNITLYLEAGATIQASTNLADYPLHAPATTLKGFFSHNQGFTSGRYLICARDAQNITITGPGRIDGQGPAFWGPPQIDTLRDEDRWHRISGTVRKPLDRVSPLLEFYNCRNVRIEDVRIDNASGYALRPINCDDVIIRGIAIRSPIFGPNTDGIDPTGCQNVFISDCIIETGDDAICLKSENPYADEVRVTRNVTITNCILTSNCNALKFGTPTVGGFENITFTNSVICCSKGPLSDRTICGITISMVDGGWIDGVMISNIRMQNVRTPISIRRGNRTPRPDGSAGTLRGIMIENIHATGATFTSSITGLPGFDVEDVTLSNIRIDSEEAGQADWITRPIPERPTDYPEAWMHGRLPAYGLYLRHAKGIRLHGLSFRAAPTEARPAIVPDDVKDLEIDAVRGPRVIPSPLGEG